MEELKNLTEEQLNARCGEYVKRLSGLSKMILEYMDGDKSNKEFIRKEYAEIKNELYQEYKYFEKEKNEIWQKGSIYNSYQTGVTKAFIHGCKAAINAKIDVKMLNTVDDALEELDFFIKY